MTAAASISAVALAAVFAWAAVAKVVDQRQVVGAFAGLGLPAPRFLAVAVPIAEALVVAALLLRPDVGGAVALAALAVFTLVIVRALSTRSPAGCGCFGSHRVEPVSPADVVRNGLLAGFAVIATGAHHLVAPSAAALVVMVAVAMVAVAAQGVARRRLGPG